ncbi:hypothetical protein AAFF_G00118710 [Aldrovandia affinis]|uniref:Uncharacterized protein n=1 Tax=Aldrovandia affinis TaxID=143900 RepID=A0AAD7RSM7_9TELE|nr:hypothetical protein AAFF_G00118710 [Aldrovandia affinis]
MRLEAWAWYKYDRLAKRLLTIGVSLPASAPYRADRNTNTSKSWQADADRQVYRTDYLVTDPLAVAHSDSV